MIYNEYGYLDENYLDQNYLGGTVLGSLGFQFESVIDSSHENGFQFDSNIISRYHANGMQFESYINDFNHENGFQFESFINDYGSYRGFQYESTINSSHENGFQFLSGLTGAKATAFQFESNIYDKLATRGFQFNSDINKTNAYGFQTQVQISNMDKVFGSQFLSEIIDNLKETGFQFSPVINLLLSHGYQFHIIVDSSKPKGFQFLNNFSDQLKTNGFQFEVSIDKQKALGFEFRKDHYQSFPIEGYLEGGYLEDPYLTGYFGPRVPFQFNGDMLITKEKGTQYLVNVIDKNKIKGTQYETEIVDKLKQSGFQFKVISTQGKTLGFEFESHIIDKLRYLGFQFLGRMVKEKPYGFQFQTITQIATGFQFLSTIYNTKQLRILHIFKSRGLDDFNWTSTSTEPGDFSPNNLDTDIIEQVWRSASGVKTGIKLTCDVGLNQICYLDTLAILNHNMTVGANILLLMSNDPLFVSGVTTVIVSARKNDTYYIAPSLPTSGFRYFQIQIDDPTNSNGFISIGNILFGSADIIHGENFTDEVDFEMVDYSDTINTEGFTNVSNSRALKRKLTLNFETLNYEKRNYDILRNVFETYRTTHKCLWIPTPSVLNQNITDRLRIFGKLVSIPKQRHNDKGPGTDYVSFTVELDESL